MAYFSLFKYRKGIVNIFKYLEMMGSKMHKYIRNSYRFHACGVSASMFDRNENAIFVCVCFWCLFRFIVSARNYFPSKWIQMSKHVYNVPCRRMKSTWDMHSYSKCYPPWYCYPQIIIRIWMYVVVECGSHGPLMIQKIK